jgi:hypothetical protein
MSTWGAANLSRHQQTYNRSRNPTHSAKKNLTHVAIKYSARPSRLGPSWLGGNKPG